MSLHMTFGQVMARLDTVEKQEQRHRKFFAPVTPGPHIKMGRDRHRYADVLQRDDQGSMRPRTAPGLKERTKVRVKPKEKKPDEPTRAAVEQRISAHVQKATRTAWHQVDTEVDRRMLRLKSRLEMDMMADRCDDLILRDPQHAATAVIFDDDAPPARRRRISLYTVALSVRAFMAVMMSAQARRGNRTKTRKQEEKERFQLAKEKLIQQGATTRIQEKRMAGMREPLSSTLAKPSSPCTPEDMRSTVAPIEPSFAKPLPQGQSPAQPQGGILESSRAAVNAACEMPALTMQQMLRSSGEMVTATTKCGVEMQVPKELWVRSHAAFAASHSPGKFEPQDADPEQPALSRGGSFTRTYGLSGVVRPEEDAHCKEFYYLQVKVEHPSLSVHDWLFDVIVTDLTHVKQPRLTFNNMRV